MTDSTPDKIQQTQLSAPNRHDSAPNLTQGLNGACDDNLPKKLSRRKLLRDSAIAVTGVVLLPSFITGCTKEYWYPGKGGPRSAPSTEPLTDFELYSAAQNLLHMNAWVEDIYLYTGNYEQYVLTLLKSGEKPTEWKDFIINILTEIANGILEAAAFATESEFPGAAPAIAIVSENIKKWAFGDRPHNLDAEFAEFKLGHLQMQKAISDMLLKLADETDHYKNLRKGWKGDIELNGKKYNLRDLAGSQFPTDSKGDAYTALRTGAYDQFRKFIWNVMIIKAGTMTYSASWWVSADHVPAVYARDTFYNDDRYKSTYLRGWRYNWDQQFVFRYWYFEFDGRELSPGAAKELFKDDSPEHIINPGGLFLRSYVFKQFHKEKPDFFGYHELRKDTNYGPNPGDAIGFDIPDNYVFTGGDFPQLTQP